MFIKLDLTYDDACVLIYDCEGFYSIEKNTITRANKTIATEISFSLVQNKCNQNPNIS